jgi:hypothetical protein
MANDRLLTLLVLVLLAWALVFLLLAPFSHASPGATCRRTSECARGEVCIIFDPAHGSATRAAAYAACAKLVRKNMIRPLL